MKPKTTKTAPAKPCRHKSALRWPGTKVGWCSACGDQVERVAAEVMSRYGTFYMRYSWQTLQPMPGQRRKKIPEGLIQMAFGVVGGVQVPTIQCGVGETPPGRRARKLALA